VAVNEEKFLGKLVYTRSGTASQHRAAVSTFRRLDKQYEELAGRWGKGALACFVGAGLAFAACFLRRHPSPVAVFFGVAFFIAFIVCVVLYMRYKRFDTEDRRYELAGQLIRLLSTDMAKDAPIRLRLDLNAPDQQSKFLRDGQAGRWRVKYYKDDWLTMQGRFLDGTSFCVTITELYQARSRTQRSQSGKTKHKSKTKTATEFSLRLKTKAKRYGSLAELAAGSKAAIQLPDIAALKSFTIQDGGLLLKAKCKRDWDATQEGKEDDRKAGSTVVAMMHLSLYQILNLSRMMTKKAG